MKVKEIMRSPVVTIHEAATLREAVALLASARVSGLPVLNAKGEMVGLVTEHDLIKVFLPTYQELLSGDASMLDPTLMDNRVLAVRDNSVSSIMTSNVVTLSEDDTILKASSTVMLRKVRILPVVRNRRPVGIVSRIDILESVLEGGCRGEKCPV